MIDLERPLGERVFDGAVVYPTLRAADHPGRLLMGVFDAAGAFVPGSELDRRSGEKGAEIPRERVGEVEDFGHPEGIYCGVLYYHFGHFLLESSARLWLAKEHPDLPLVWAGASNWNKTDHRRPGTGGDTRLTPEDWAPDRVLAPWQSEVLEILGLPNPVMVVTAPTRFGRLHIPDIGYRYDDQFHPQHASFMAAYHGPSRQADAKLWLSRSRISKDVRDLNEATAERRLADAGWTVAHPEAQTVREQLDQFSRASIVSGEEGSAFHVLMLLADPVEAELRIIRRYGNEHRNMHTVGDTRGVTQSFVSLEHTVVLRADGRAVTKVSASPAEILDALDVPIAAPAPRTEEQTVAEAARDERLARLADAVHAGRVLWIGVADGPGERSLQGRQHRVVADRLTSDPRVVQSDDVEVFEVPVAQYFAAFADPETYGIIRIGPATGADMFTAFCASQRNADQHTVWVIDDAVRPAVAESATEGWMTLLRVLDAFPSLTARIVAGDDETQAVVWAAPRGEYQRIDGAADLPSHVGAMLKPTADEKAVFDDVVSAVVPEPSVAPDEPAQPSPEHQAEAPSAVGERTPEGPSASPSSALGPDSAQDTPVDGTPVTPEGGVTGPSPEAGAPSDPATGSRASAAHRPKAQRRRPRWLKFGRRVVRGVRRRVKGALRR